MILFLCSQLLAGYRACKLGQQGVDAPVVQTRRERSPAVPFPASFIITDGPPHMQASSIKSSIEAGHHSAAPSGVSVPMLAPPFPCHAALFVDGASTMQQFMWQQDVIGVAHFVQVALTCWMCRSDRNLSYHIISPGRLEQM